MAKRKPSNKKRTGLSGTPSFSTQTLTSPKMIDAGKMLGLAVAGNIAGEFTGKGANKLIGGGLIVASVMTGKSYLAPIGVGLFVSNPSTGNILKSGSVKGIDGIDGFADEMKVRFGSVKNRLATHVSEISPKLGLSIGTPIAGIEGLEGNEYMEGYVAGLAELDEGGNEQVSGLNGMQYLNGVESTNLVDSPYNY